MQRLSCANILKQNIYHLGFQATMYTMRIIYSYIQRHVQITFLFIYLEKYKVQALNGRKRKKERTKKRFTTVLAHKAVRRKMYPLIVKAH